MSNTYKSVNIPGNLSGGGSGNPPYSLAFNDDSSWTLDGSDYRITVPSGVHQRGPNVIVKAYQSVGSDFEEVEVHVTKTSAGSVTIRVGLTSRFSGKLIIIGE
jgi:hypothetical protein